ncbi:MAG TPA: hypothetical protein VGD52_05250 [Pseudoduganella sp.]
MFHGFRFAGGSALFERCGWIASIFNLPGSAFRIAVRAFGFSPSARIFGNRRLQHVLHHGAQFLGVGRQAAPSPQMNIVLDFRFLFGAQGQAAEGEFRPIFFHDGSPDC